MPAVFPFYMDSALKPYAVSHTQLYCNTPSDFDFRLDNPALSVRTMQASVTRLTQPPR